MNSVKQLDGTNQLISIFSVIEIIFSILYHWPAATESTNDELKQPEWYKLVDIIILIQIFVLSVLPPAPQAGLNG